MLLSDDAVTPVTSQTPRLRSTCDSASTTGNWLSNGRRVHPRQQSALTSRSKRFCPYPRSGASDSRKLFGSLSCHRRRTDASRHRLSRSVRDNSAAEPADDKIGAVKGLVNKTWRIHRVSPLYKFCAKPASLKLYARHLSAHIESISTKQVASVEDSADFAQIKLFRVQCSDIANDTVEGIEIILLQRHKNSQCTAPTVVLNALMVSAAKSADANMTLGGIESPFTSLPLLLVRGPARLADVLTSWWQTQFDCCVSPLKLSPNELSWMVAMFAGFTPDVRARSVEFVYKMPEEVTEMSKIVYTIDAQDCRRLWASIHDDEDDDMFRSEEVVSFHLALEQHFFQHFRVKLAALKLARIGTSTVYVSCDGALKMFSEGHVMQILSYLDRVVRRQDLTNNETDGDT